MGNTCACTTNSKECSYDQLFANQKEDPDENELKNRGKHGSKYTTNIIG